MENYTWFGSKEYSQVIHKRLGGNFTKLINIGLYVIGYASTYAYFQWDNQQCTSTADPELFFHLLQLDLKSGADINLIFNVVCHSCAHFIINVSVVVKNKGRSFVTGSCPANQGGSFSNTICDWLEMKPMGKKRFLMRY